MNWIKQGKLFNFKRINKDLLTHASNPLAIHLKDNTFRIFFSSRNKDNKSSIAFVDIDILTKEVKKESTHTVFKYSDNESYYSHGISLGNSYTVGKDSYILFMGWQIKNNEHWRGKIGRLLIKENQVLTLNNQSAFISYDKEDRISLSYPWVIFDEGIYKMWYGSTYNWSSLNGEMIHVIKYATSLDGTSWIKHGLAIPYEIGKAQAFSRPSVIKNKKGYHMWFSYRGDNRVKYRIGYAHSFDGVNWRRNNHFGIDVSSNGWDSEMTCYPFVFQHNQNTYMLYNGNSYGKTGFGLAILKEN
jgi:hypothetical protein